MRHLRNYLRYDKETGHLFWRVPRSTNIKEGSQAGYFHNNYMRIEVLGKGYMVHRVAWYLHHGKEPSGEIDHINGNTKDNRIENLRDVTKRQNISNSYRHRAGKLVGCSYDKRRKKWKAKIVVNKVEHWLGYFSTELEAHKAYVRALNKFSI